MAAHTRLLLIQAAFRTVQERTVTISVSSWPVVDNRVAKPGRVLQWVVSASRVANVVKVALPMFALVEVDEVVIALLIVSGVVG